MKRRSSSVFFSLALAATLFGMLSLVHGIPPGDEDGGLGIGAFAKRVAGSYLIELSLLGKSFLILQTYNADGNAHSEDTTDFGFDVKPAFQSGMWGTWKQTGERELVLNRLGFDFDEDGMFTNYIRSRSTAEFSGDFKEFSEWGIVEIFLPFQDPLDPNETPIVSFDFDAEGRLIPSKIGD